MKIAIVSGLGGTALALAACVPPHANHAWGGALKPVARLDCPSKFEELQLSTGDADRKSCLYKGPDDSEVQLMLLPVTGDPDQVLSPIEAQLKTQLPAPPTSAAPAQASASPPASDASAAANADQKVDIRLPGISIQADNDKANVNVGPIHVNADGDDDNVHVHGGPGPFGRGQFTVDADNGSVIVRTHNRGPNVDESLVLASNTSGPQGWRLLGYDALGPRSGPLVVATVKSRSDRADRAMAQARRLVRRSAQG
jgi:hypothetical protein